MEYQMKKGQRIAKISETGETDIHHKDSNEQLNNITFSSQIDAINILKKKGYEYGWLR